MLALSRMFIVHPEVVNYVPNDAKFTAVSEIRHLRCFYHGHPGWAMPDRCVNMQGIFMHVL